jgi:ElaB/YqjD/DUF883 family membrane-anchored ribosome-binding protein
MLFSRPENWKDSFTKPLALRQFNVARIGRCSLETIIQGVSSGQHWCPSDSTSVRARFLLHNGAIEDRGSIMAITKQDLQSLRDECGALAAEVSKLMEASDQHNADELKDRIGKVRAKFESALSDAGNSGRDPIHELSENIADVVEESLRERPIATLAVALGLGFIVGAALRG